jgi:hypothetical protein
VVGDLFDYFFFCVFIALLFGEVEAGDLQAVEEQAGSFRVEVIAGDALEDHSDGGLDGGAVFG